MEQIKENLISSANQMKQLQTKLINALKGYSFDEMKALLDKQAEPEVRGTILRAMETYHEQEFKAWLGV